MPRPEELMRLGRPVDWNYPTNRAIALISLAVLVTIAGWQMVAGTGATEAALQGLSAALSTFLAWALAREIAPDGERAAFAAAALGAVAGVARLGAFGAELIGPAPDVAALFWLLLLVRLINRTVGRAPAWLDSGAVLGLTLYGVWIGHWPVGVVGALGFLVDAVAVRPLRRHLGFAAVAVVAAVIGFGRSSGGRPDIEEGLVPTVLFAGSALAALRWIFGSPSQSLGDGDGLPLDSRRVGAARGVFALAAWAFAWQGGHAGVWAMVPAWAALFGTVLWPARR